MTTAAPHAGGEASAWVQRWSHLVAPGARVLDLACGAGRHLRWFAARACVVTGIDRNADLIAPLANLGELIVADLEGDNWPLNGRSFDAVIVTHYLWRERFAQLVACVKPGGLLIYETFAAGNETVGKPSNPAFLLQRGELLRLCAGLRIVAFEDGFETSPDRFVQRIVALRVDPGHASPTRLPLSDRSALDPRVKSRDSEDLP